MKGYVQLEIYAGKDDEADTNAVVWVVEAFETGTKQTVRKALRRALRKALDELDDTGVVLGDPRRVTKGWAEEPGE